MISPEMQAQLDAAVAESAKSLQQCELCPRLTHTRGVFVTDEPAFGTVDGEPRAVIYAICPACLASPAATELAEAKVAYKQAARRPPG